jgi:hypothetical protein
MKARWVAAIGCLVVGLSVSSAVAEMRREQSVGVAPIGEDTGVPREAAMQEAVRAAVLRTAMELLPEGFVPPEPGIGDDGLPEEPERWLEERLGEDPFVYVSRFRVVEDRGRRPAMFAGDPQVEEEYVVVADVSVDVDAVRDRLNELGLLRAPGGSGRAITLVIQGLDAYRPLAMLRETLLEDHNVESVVPVEFTSRRAVLSVRADRDAPALVAALSQSAPEGLQIVVVDQRAREATLLIDWRPPDPSDATTSPARAGTD